MKTGIISTLAIGAALSLSAAVALASDDSDDNDNIEISAEATQSIQNTLAEQGYEVGEIELENDLYEAYAQKDGQEFEVLLDAEFKIVQVEVED